jgi:endoglucanase
MVFLNVSTKDKARFALRSAITILLACAVSPSFGAECLRGANVAGAEFGKPGGAYGKAYVYPSKETLVYLASKDMNVIRLPFKWERLQPELFGPLDLDELDRLNTSVEAARRLGMAVVIDPHNYARFKDELIGSPAVPVAAFADFWSRLAPEFSGRENVIYLLMNEPYGLPARDWLEAANASIAAIRGTGADNLVMVPGTIWTGASHWLDPQEGGSNAEVLTGVTDPLNRFVFDIHQYLDDDFSGTNASCPRTGDAIAALETVTAWFEKTGNRGFLGEFGGTDTPECLSGLRDVTEFINARPESWIGWAYWAAGDWWGAYPLSIQPDEGIDRPQMAAIEPAIGRESDASRNCRPFEELTLREKTEGQDD